MIDTRCSLYNSITLTISLKFLLKTLGIHRERKGHGGWQGLGEFHFKMMKNQIQLNIYLGMDSSYGATTV